MEKRTILFLFISMVILVAFQVFYFSPMQKRNAELNKREIVKTTETKETTTPTEVKDTTVTTETKNTLVPKKVTKTSESVLEDFMTLASQPTAVAAETKIFENVVYSCTVQNIGGTIAKLTIKKYDFSLPADNSFILRFTAPDNTVYTDATIPYAVTIRNDGFDCVYETKTFTIKKSFTFGQGTEKDYFITLSVDSPIPFDSVAVNKRMMSDKNEFQNNLPVQFDKKYRQIKVKKDKPVNGDYDYWTGFESKYFLFLAMRPDSSVKAEYFMIPKKEGSADTDTFGGVFYFEGKSLDFFYGPKELKLLKKVDPRLDKSVNLSYSLLRPISLLMLSGMQELYKLVKNYGIAIIILTLLIRLLFWPLTHKSSVSMAKMQKLQPEIQKLQKQYKDKPQELNTKLMQLYQKHKVNPMGGCLPILLQLPVLFALYSVFNSAIELRGAPFGLWIKDLSQADTLFSLGFNLPFLGSNVNILPLLMMATMIWQMKLNSAQSASMQGFNKFLMTYFMPVFMLILFYSLPSGLTLYFLFSNLLGILQQMYTNKHLKKGA